MSELTLVPDRQPKNEIYYNYQIVTLTATLVRSKEIEEGETLHFLNVSTYDKGVPNTDVSLVAYQSGGGYEEVDATTVSVPITRTGPGEGYATLTVLVAGKSNADDQLADPYQVTAETEDKSIVSNSIVFKVADAELYSSVTRYGAFIPMSNSDMVPAQGSFVYYQFSVMGDDLDPLPRMRIRLSGWALGMDGYSITQVLLYDNYDSVQPLQWDPAQDWKGFCLNLETDDQGHAEVFLCPKAGASAADELRVSIGTDDESAGLFFVADLNDDDSGITAPYTKTSIVDIEGEDSVPVYIPKYPGASDTDIVYLFCNGEYQGTLSVDDINKDPLGSIGVAASGLYSTTYGQSQPENKIQYIVPQAEVVFVSPKGKFRAQGTLQPVSLSDCDSGASAPAPLLPDDPYGYPINQKMASNGIRLRVPLDGLEIGIGDYIDINACINAFRQYPDKDEPRGVGFSAGDPMRISPSMMNDGYVDWWFQSSMFMGFGQNDKNEYGTFEARFKIVYGRDEAEYSVQNKEDVVTYCSDVLTLWIDTIPPTGGDSVAVHDGVQQGAV